MKKKCLEKLIDKHIDSAAIYIKMKKKGVSKKRLKKATILMHKIKKLEENFSLELCKEINKKES